MDRTATVARLGQLWRALRLVLAGLAIGLLPLVAQGVGAASTSVNSVTFKLVPNAKFAACLARYPNDPARPPTATVTVSRGALNDKLVIHAANIKPGLGFDLFTVQKSPLLANGQPDPAFTGSFGMAWYQSDLQANGSGVADATINTILLDQIFGFDPDVNLAPTNTFHVGFWFNNPADAAPCGFTGVTPFNGDHRAGPLAMISLPNAATNLGPLCTALDPTTRTCVA